MADAKAFVDGLIAAHKVVVFSKTYCPHCQGALTALKSFSPTGMHVEQIENRPDMDAIQDYLKSITGARSVPRVFVGHKFLGGGDETRSKAGTGQLLQLLKDAGALPRDI
eukprot:GHVS01033416.1.p1 GENE.GHVS01033416.1~~GHVS01033416.1.p1  ORF type:complete len:110 (-),score=18.32 GHVS01033416.1:140-469(-)